MTRSGVAVVSVVGGPPPAGRALWASIVGYCARVCEPGSVDRAVAEVLASAAHADAEATRRATRRIAAGYAGRAPAERSTPRLPWQRGGGAAHRQMPVLLAARANGELPPHDLDLVALHLGQCPACQALASTRDAAEEVFSVLAATPPPDPREEETAFAPTTAAASEEEAFAPQPTSEAAISPPSVEPVNEGPVTSEWAVPMSTPEPAAAPSPPPDVAVPPTAPENEPALSEWAIPTRGAEPVADNDVRPGDWNAVGPEAVPGEVTGVETSGPATGGGRLRRRLSRLWPRSS